MFRRIFLSSAATLAMIASAAAADLPSEKGPPVYAPPPPPLFSWTGLYVGGNVGGAWDSSFFTDNTGTGVPASFHGSGIVGGGQAGFRYQISQFVFGVEGSFDGSNVSSTVTGPGGSDRLSVRELYTATGQAGFAWDRWLIYGKGGWAGSQSNWFAQNTAATASNWFGASGWTAGGGVEYAILPNVNIGVEYDHFDLRYGPGSAPASNGGAAFVRTSGNEYIDQVVARLEYKFDLFAAPPPAPPVVSKY